MSSLGICWRGSPRSRAPRVRRFRAVRRAVATLLRRALSYARSWRGVSRPSGRPPGTTAGVHDRPEPIIRAPESRHGACQIVSTTPDRPEPAVGEGGADTSQHCTEQPSAAFVCFAFALGGAVSRRSSWFARWGSTDRSRRGHRGHSGPASLYHRWAGCHCSLARARTPPSAKVAASPPRLSRRPRLRSDALVGDPHVTEQRVARNGRLGTVTLGDIDHIVAKEGEPSVRTRQPVGTRMTRSPAIPMNVSRAPEPIPLEASMSTSPPEPPLFPRSSPAQQLLADHRRRPPASDPSSLWFLRDHR